jgi:hypothetical protein
VRDDGEALLVRLDADVLVRGLGLLRKVAEVLLDHRLDVLGIGVGDNHHRRIGCAVPGAVVVLEILLGHAADGLLGADGKTHAEQRPGGHLLEHLILRALTPGEAAPTLLLDDLTLFLDLIRKERESPDNIAEELHALTQRLGLGIGKRELVRGLVEAGEGVLVATEGHAQRLEERDEGAGREVRRTVERHVLQVVRDAALAVGLIERTGVDVDPDGRATGRHGVLLDDVPQAVLQFARDERGIGRQVHIAHAFASLAALTFRASHTRAVRLALARRLLVLRERGSGAEGEDCADGESGAADGRAGLEGRAGHGEASGMCAAGKAAEEECTGTRRREWRQVG